MTKSVTQRFTQRLPKPLQVAIEIACIAMAGLLVAFLLNNFVFRIYSVNGPSMQPTLHTNDKLVVNKFSQTVAKATNKPFQPARLQLIVFKNPLFNTRPQEEFIVKRVIGLPGERVVVQDNHITIFNTEHPEGFDPDKTLTLAQPTAGRVDRVVPENEVFAVGDNRVGEYSFDSRNGLSTIRTQNIDGVVIWRFFPLNKWQLL